MSADAKTRGVKGAFVIEAFMDVDDAEVPHFKVGWRGGRRSGRDG